MTEYVDAPPAIKLSEASATTGSAPSVVENVAHERILDAWGSWVEGFAPGMMGGPHGDALFVFALPNSH